MERAMTYSPILNHRYFPIYSSIYNILQFYKQYIYVRDINRLQTALKSQLELN